MAKLGAFDKNIMSPIFSIVAAFVVVLILKAVWKGRPRMPHEEGFRYVYINQDGSARELTESEQEYLETDFEGGDSGRPYVKSSYGSKDGWGSISGFIERRKVPSSVPIVGISSAALPDEGESLEDMIAEAEAVGDVVEHGSDGFVKISPNPGMSSEERYSLLAERQLQRQRMREEAVMKFTIPKKDAVEWGCRD